MPFIRTTTNVNLAVKHQEKAPQRQELQSLSEIFLDKDPIQNDDGL